MKFYLFFLSVFTFSCFSMAAEESLDLDTLVESAPKQEQLLSKPKFSLMGRVDLISERTARDSTNNKEGHSLKNNHFLIFLKVKASDKTSFMGEFVEQSFYYVDHEASNYANILFGKVLVPFGDTRRFHHFYGGVQGFGSQGVMFPNVWAAQGINVNWKFKGMQLDTYWVNSLSAADSSSDPTFSTISEERQAEGFRLTLPLAEKLTGILSAYGGEYWSGRSLLIGGLDVYSDYGGFGLRLFRDLRLAFGIANAYIKEAPVTGDFEKRGDYLEIVSRHLGPGEIRLRYGTYIDNSKTESVKDTNSFSAGYIFNVDVINLLAEYQWNYEAINEIDNDSARIIASLNF